MSITAGLLAGTSLFFERGKLEDVYRLKSIYIIIGLLAAVGLYGVFWLGNFISTHVLPFAVSQVDSIYTIRSGQNPWVISLLLLLLIGPAEEIFWRGFVQRRLCKQYGLLVGFIVAVMCYALVHIWSFNFMLIAAAAVCGGFWGLLYMTTGNLWSCIISHAVWDVIILIIFPIK